MKPTDQFRLRFADPPREFGFMPFWFWNDDLSDAELVRQVREFHAKGYGGFIPHARIGLSRRLGYLTPEFFRLVRLAVNEAGRLGMKVVLYDEGAYPSGSARGGVVAENPDWSAKCLTPLYLRVKGPAKGFWRPNPGRALTMRLVAVVAARETGKDSLDPASLQCLEWDDHELVRYDLPKGQWRIVAVWEGHSGGTIRGVFEEEEDGHALAPPAGDILRKDAVSCFIRLTHDAYFKNLRGHFGKTVVSMFTDEPNPLGRCSGDDKRAWTPGFMPDVQRLWDDKADRWLPALWLDCGPRTDAFRWTWRDAVQRRLEDTFYRQISDWCSEHGIALTGHAGDSNEMGTLRHFHWPGQDMVWRYITPDCPQGTVAKHALAAKSASSAACLGRRRFSPTEVFGAYGWSLSLDEMKWLLDWHFVRGTNLVFPHAAFYSIRGRRAYESEPDIAFHNVAWPYGGLLGNYGRRMCGLFSDGALVCRTGIVSDGDDLSGEAAWVLQRAQQDFVFIDDTGLRTARVEGGRLVAGDARLNLLVVDKPGILSEAAQVRLRSFERGGGAVLRRWAAKNLAGLVAARVGCDAVWQGKNAADLRVMHYRKCGREIFLLVNEGDGTLEGMVRLATSGSVEKWDALDGSTVEWPGFKDKDGVKVPVRLGRRESVILVVDPGKKPYPKAQLPAIPGKVWREITGQWSVTSVGGPKAPLSGPCDWSRVKGWETFSGAAEYHVRFELTTLPGRIPMLFLDLGRVGDIADVRVNGRSIGVRAWAPYVFPLRDCLKPGVNALDVRVTNSMANAYDGRQLPSGLIGPVHLRRAGACGARLTS